MLRTKKDVERTRILETLAKGWVEQRKIRIRYQRLDGNQHVNHVISPYLIEPSNWSDSVYVIALSDVTDKIIPFKIDRIESAVLSGEGFEIPADFDDQELLKYAWGIWVGDKEPALVRLRFNGSQATRRVRESIWHPQQEPLEELPDGGCIWSARVAEWLGKKPPNRNDILLNWRGKPFTYHYVSFSDVYLDMAKETPTRPANEFRGKTLVIGSTAAGLLDVRGTPLDRSFPGVEILATAIDNLRHGDWLRAPEARLFYLGMAHSQLKETKESNDVLQRALALNLPTEMAEQARKTLAQQQ